MKTPKDSQVEMRYIVMPHHSNPRNTVFGGVIMSWIDMATGMAAQKHANLPVVTVRIDTLSFKAPIKIGECALIRAKVNYVGKSSLVVEGKVWGENLLTNKSWEVAAAHVIFVALDNNGKPCPVPPLSPQSEEEKKAFDLAKKVKNSKVN